MRFERELSACCRVVVCGSIGLLLAGGVPVSAALQSFTIFHVNDMHARLTPHQWVVPAHNNNSATKFELVGGAAYLATEVLQRKAADPDSLMLDAGDISEGNPLGDMGGNGAMVGFYNILDAKLKAQGGRGLDASVVGNHDIRQRSYIDNLKNKAHYPVISVNICSNGTQSPYFKPYVVITLPQHNGLRVGVLGYTTETADLGPETSDLLSVVKCDWSSTNSGRIHIRDWVAELRTNEHCGVVILLAHSGHAAICMNTADSKALLVDEGGPVRVPEVVVSGHWHTWAETGWQPELLNYKTIFTESASYMKYLGELRVTEQGQFVSATQHVIRVSELTPDPGVTNYIAALEREYAATGAPAIHEVVGYTADNLMLDDHMKWWSPSEYPWNGDNTAGGWICDSMQWKAAQLATHCDLAMQAGGGVRADVPAGPVTYLQIYETYPWSDDGLMLVRMSGRELYNYILDNGCGAALSRDWLVLAHDGVPTNITYKAAPLVLTNTYRVALSSYMYTHGRWADQNPLNLNYSIRRAMVEYTHQFDAAHPMTVPGPRYQFDTAFSGGYRAVVTVVNDADSKTTHEDAFLRLLSATPETLARRGAREVPAALVNADGTVNKASRLSEIEFYRSFLGFRTNLLHRGDIIEVWGKSGFHGGEPEFAEQEGIMGDGMEIRIVGHDEALAQPTREPSINAFWNDEHKNHYVKFLARKTGRNTVADQNDTPLTILNVKGHANMHLPGKDGDWLQVTGLPMSRSHRLQFRCDTVQVSTNGAGLERASGKESIR